jgi:hypothetical protein
VVTPLDLPASALQIALIETAVSTLWKRAKEMILKAKPLHFEWRKTTFFTGAFLLLLFVALNFMWLPGHLPHNL